MTKLMAALSNHSTAELRSIYHEITVRGGLDAVLNSPVHWQQLNSLFFQTQSMKEYSNAAVELGMDHHAHLHAHHVHASKPSLLAQAAANKEAQHADMAMKQEDSANGDASDEMAQDSEVTEQSSDSEAVQSS